MGLIDTPLTYEMTSRVRPSICETFFFFQRGRRFGSLYCVLFLAPHPKSGPFIQEKVELTNWHSLRT